MALRSWMESVNDAAVTSPNPLVPQVLADEAVYEGGDPVAGQDLYDAACGDCHDTGLVLSVVSPRRAAIALRTVGRIAQKVRTSARRRPR